MTDTPTLPAPAQTKPGKATPTAPSIKGTGSPADAPPDMAPTVRPGARTTLANGLMLESF